MNEELENNTENMSVPTETKIEASYGNELVALNVVKQSFLNLDAKFTALKEPKYYSIEQEKILVEELIKLVKDTLPLVCEFKIISNNPLRSYRLSGDNGIENLLKETNTLIDKKDISLKLVQNDNALDILTDGDKWTDADYVRNNSLKQVLLDNVNHVLYIIGQYFMYILTNGLASKSLMLTSDMASAINSTIMFKDVVIGTNAKIVKFKENNEDEFTNIKNIIRNMLGLVNGELAISKSLGISEDKVLRRQIYDIMQLAAHIHAAKTYSIDNSRLDATRLLELSKAIELEKQDPSLINPETTKIISDSRYELKAQSIQSGGCTLTYTLDKLNKSFNSIKENDGFLTNEIEADNIHVAAAEGFFSLDYADEKIESFNLLDLLVDEIPFELNKLYYMLVIASYLLRKAINDTQSSDIGVPPVDLNLEELFSIRSYDEMLSNTLITNINDLLPEHKSSVDLIHAFINSRVESYKINDEVISKVTTFFRSAEDVSLSINHIAVAHRVLSLL